MQGISGKQFKFRSYDCFKTTQLSLTYSLQQKCGIPCAMCVQKQCLLQYTVMQSMYTVYIIKYRFYAYYYRNVSQTHPDTHSCGSFNNLSFSLPTCRLEPWPTICMSTVFSYVRNSNMSTQGKVNFEQNTSNFSITLG